MQREFPPLEPKIVLAIGAHPDDLEFGVSGTVAAWVKAGAEVHYLICTDGGKGTEDMTLTSPQLTELRRAEQRAAGEVLGLTSVQFFDYEDGLVEAKAALKRDIVRVIREIKPDTVLAQDPLEVYNADFGVINHNDHRKVGEAVMDAVYPLARDHLSFPELYAAGLAPHKVADLLFMSMGSGKANYFVDITDVYETKLKALAAHASQVDIERARTWLDPMSEATGKLGGYGRAESFIRLNMFI